MSQNTTLVKATHCTYCGQTLNDDEANSPEKDEDGDVMCDDCHKDHYMDSCERCQNYVDKKDLDCSPGNLIVTWREAPGRPDDLSPGYYRVKEWPFFADGMIEGYMISRNLEKIGDLSAADTKVAADAWTECSPLCSECREKIETQFKNGVPS